MTATAQDRNTPEMSNHSSIDKIYCPIDAVKVYKGSLVAINAAGYLVPAATGSDKQLKCIGRCEATVDNSGGSAGDKSVTVTRGTFQWGNSATTSAITQADVGRIVYAADDQTISRVPNLGALPAAGRCMGFDASGVWVDTTSSGHSVDGSLELVLLSTGDLSAKQFFFVAQDASNGVAVASAAGQICLGIVQNAPAAAAMAIVRILGKSRCIAGTAVVQASKVATASTGKAGIASLLVQATGAGSYMMGFALTAAAADTNPFEIFLTHSGALPTSAA